MQFWSKCNKLLVDGSNKLIYCDNCPCGYYAIFGIKYRDLTYPSMQPYNKCSWYYDVQAFHVIDNKIQWNYYGNMCIPVNRSMGYCGTNKNCADCYEQCTEWDQETWECKKYQPYCYGCVEAMVYNISGCFENYQDFAEYFYSACGVQPSAQGKYPDIWYNSYGYEYMTDSASNCVSSYWNQIFADKYMLSYSAVSTIVGQCWWADIGVQHYVMTTQCYSYCTDSDGNYCGQVDSQGNCTGQGCTNKHQECWEMQDHADYVGGSIYLMAADGSATNQLWVNKGGWYGPGQGCWGDYPCFHADCHDYINAYYSNGELNSAMFSGVQDKNKYVIYHDSYYGSKGTGTTSYNCENSNSLCIEFSYSSGIHDNYYWNMATFQYMFRWGKIVINRNSKTPSSANGIKFECTITRTKNIYEQPDVVEKQTFDLSLNFGQEYTEFPLCTDVQPITILSVPQYDNDCNYVQGELNTIPYTWGNWGKKDNVSVKLVAKEYI